VSVSAGGPGEQGPPQGLASAVAEVSERATLLVREEIELAKAEISEKTARLARGAVIGVAAGVFVLTALFFILVGCAWLLYYELPIGNQFTYFWGFFIMAAILIVLGVLAGLLAARAVRSSAPPVPEMAIDQARKIRDTVASSSDRGAAPSASSAYTDHSVAGSSSAGSAPAPPAAPMAPSSPIPAPGPPAASSQVTESPDA
jgi:predicted lipid-binding transport protein (Tim44 family)